MGVFSVCLSRYTPPFYFLPVTRTHLLASGWGSASGRHQRKVRVWEEKGSWSPFRSLPAPALHLSQQLHLSVAPTGLQKHHALPAAPEGAPSHCCPSPVLASLCLLPHSSHISVTSILSIYLSHLVNYVFHHGLS